MSDIVTGSTALAAQITALHAENERLKVESIQMQAALGYGILAEDERHIIPSNPFKCGTCDRARAEVERLRAALEAWNDAVLVNVVMEGPRYAGTHWKRAEAAWEKARAALEEKQ